MGGTTPAPITTGGAYYMMVANAIKACGTLVRVEPRQFLEIVDRMDAPLVVHAKGGFMSTWYKYLTSYRGLAFHCKSREPLTLPRQTELIEAKKITIPDV